MIARLVLLLIIHKTSSAIHNATTTNHPIHMFSPKTSDAISNKCCVLHVRDMFNPVVCDDMVKTCIVCNENSKYIKTQDNLSQELLSLFDCKTVSPAVYLSQNIHNLSGVFLTYFYLFHLRFSFVVGSQIDHRSGSASIPPAGPVRHR